MHSATFKRGQVVWAVWRSFSRAGEHPPKQFITRVRKMGELGVPLSDYDRPGQSGIDAEYTVEHAFELAVALKLLDIGLKQSEVAYFIQHIRDELRRSYQKITAGPLSGGQLLSSKDRPSGPTQVIVIGGSSKKLANPFRSKIADTGFYLTFRSIEIREAWSSKRSSKEPIIYAPKFHHGLESLIATMETLSETYGDDTRIVIELSNIAEVITASLQTAPKARRGR